MPEPQEYSVHAELAKRVIAVDAVQVKVTATDPGEMLFRPYDNDIVKTDLTQWMTFLKKDRLKKVERYADRKSPFYTEGRFPDKVSADDARKRYLMVIFYREATHGDGSREVALLAVNALFPEKG